MATDHPLAALLQAAAAGVFPPADGQVEIYGSPPGRCDAVVAFTGHAVVAAGVDPHALADRIGAPQPADPLAAVVRAFAPDTLRWLGQALGTSPGLVDAVLAAPATTPGPGGLHMLGDSEGVERVRRALWYREDVTIWTDEQESALVTLGRGLAGRWEVSLEVDATARGRGRGRAVLHAARSLLPAGETLFAQVSPGNAASLRTFLAAGFIPIGAEVLFRRPD